MANERRRVVTPEQLTEGWLELVGNVIIKRKYVVVGRTPDGYLIVKEPAPTPEDPADRLPFVDAR